MNKKIKLNLTIVTLLIITYLIIQYVFPIKGLEPINTISNYIYRLIFTSFLGIVYLYCLLAQFYQTKTNKSLTLEMMKHHHEKKLFQLLVESLKATQPKHLIKTPGKPKTGVTGIIFGKDEHGLLVESSIDEEEHILCVGGSGSGKTSAFLIPTLRAFKGTYFAIDISGDIVNNVNHTDTLVLNPFSGDSITYNVFYFIDNIPSKSEKLELLSQLAFLIMPDIINNNSDGRFFLENGRKILIAALIHYYELNFDFNEICEKILYSDIEELFNEIWKQKNKYACLYISSFRDTNEKNTAGCKQAMDASITFFAINENMQRILRRPRPNEKSVTPAILENKNVIVQIAEVKLTIYAPFLAIMIAQTFEYCSQRSLSEKKPILFALDEFARFGRIDILNALRTLRKRRVRILLLTQSFADLDATYSKVNRMIMADNCGYKVILRITDPETQDYVSRLIGDDDIYKLSHNWNSNQNGYSKTPHRERIIPPAELAYLGDKLLVHGPTGYRILSKNWYFKD